MAASWRSQAATLLVYNNNDANAGSLRQALSDNAALGGGNTIIFSNTVTGTITLGSALSISAGVTILGPTNLPSTMPYHASQLYARNVSALVQHLAPEGELRLDFEDEITAGACVTRKQEVPA